MDTLGVKEDARQATQKQINAKNTQIAQVNAQAFTA